MSAVHLRDRGIVEVAGPDAATFLQGLVTNDITRASAERAVYAALLTPQGKIIYDFIVTRTGDNFRLDCAKVHAPDLAARLKKYKLRAKVTVEDRSSILAVLWQTVHDPGSVEDPRHAALGFRAYVEQPQAPDDATAYNARRLEIGVPDSAVDIPPETYFPLDCNFEELHGVDFEKGCYVGQELTSRMKHRATARKRMLPVTAEAELPKAGTALKLGANEIGELRGTFGTRGLALVRLDRLGEAETATADGITVRIGRPAYPLILPSGDEHS